MRKDERTELRDFLRFCRSERRLAPMTCSAYERDVSACLGYSQREGIAMAEAKVTHLRAFLAEEQERRPAVSSQARTTAALKCFFRFLVEEERQLRDPALPLRTPKKPEVPPDVLTMGELERLLAATGRVEVWERHFPGKPQRDRLLLALMAATAEHERQSWVRMRVTSATKFGYRDRAPRSARKPVRLQPFLSD